VLGQLFTSTYSHGRAVHDFTDGLSRLITKDATPFPFIESRTSRAPLATWKGMIGISCESTPSTLWAPTTLTDCPPMLQLHNRNLQLQKSALLRSKSISIPPFSLLKHNSTWNVQVSSQPPWLVWLGWLEDPCRRNFRHSDPQWLRGQPARKFQQSGTYATSTYLTSDRP
jgi:hypothetical protein